MAHILACLESSLSRLKYYAQQKQPMVSMVLVMLVLVMLVLVMLVVLAQPYFIYER